MPVEVESGRRIDVRLPPSSPWSEFNDACDAYLELVQERQVTARRLSGLEGERTRAIEQDRLAYAKALREGKDDPGSKRVEKLEREIAACHRRLDAIGEAIDMATDELVASVDEHRAEWEAGARQLVDVAQREYAGAIETVATAKARVDTSFALLSFVAGFPESEVSYRVRGSFVGALKAPNADPYYFAQVIDALRADAQMPLSPPHAVVNDPLAQATQELHDERLANEQAGRGYFSDDELKRIHENEVEFFHGAGARDIAQVKTAPKRRRKS